MRSNYKKLGGYIRPVDERNRDLAITNLQGVSIAKEFVPSIANIIGTDLSTYKIVRTGQFAYGPVTSRNGDKVSIALLKGEDCIISSSYVPFEVYKPDELLPEYLMLWFMRPEFDRYARFMSNGSAREVFDWDSMCGVELPVPSLPEQRKIVHDYKVITDRIDLLNRICLNLDELALTVYKKRFVENIDENTLPDGWKMGTLQDIYKFQYGKGNNNPDNGGQYPVYGSNGIIGWYDEYNNEDEPVIGHIGAAGSLNFAYGKHFVTYNGIMCNILNPRDMYFGYICLLSQNLAAQVRGSTQPFISYDMLYEIKLVIPSEDALEKYNQVVTPLMELKREVLTEISALKKMQELLKNMFPTH